MGNNKYKVLIVEDDQSILGFVQTILETNGYQVLTAERCRQGLLIFSSYTPDLVVLDLGLPDMDGGEFIRQVRLFSTVPIIVLSARTEENDKVSALDLGANDYITKPFGTAELLARVRAALRASRNRARVAPSNLFTVDDLVIDYDRRQVSVGGSPVPDQDGIQHSGASEPAHRQGADLRHHHPLRLGQHGRRERKEAASEHGEHPQEAGLPSGGQPVRHQRAGRRIPHRRRIIQSLSGKAAVAFPERLSLSGKALPHFYRRRSIIYPNSGGVDVP